MRRKPKKEKKKKDEREREEEEERKNGHVEWTFEWNVDQRGGGAIFRTGGLFFVGKKQKKSLTKENRR